MPLTLPPVSRRRFLASTLAAGAGLLLGPSSLLRAAASSPDVPDRLTLLSDTHINADPGHVARGVHLSGNLRQAVADVLELRSSAGPAAAPIATLLNGDCAHLRGRTEDYAQLLPLLRPLREAGLPVHLLLGNHDHRDRVRAALPLNDLARHSLPPSLRDRHVRVLQARHADWILLDSLDVTNGTPGRLGTLQLAWLQQALDAPERRDKPVLIMMHHQPQLARTTTFPTTLFSRVSGLLDTQAFYDVITPRRNVKAVLFGHTHVWSQKTHAGIHLVNLPAVAYVFDEKQPSGWVDCSVSATSARFQLKCLNRKHPWHNQVADLPWRT